MTLLSRVGAVAPLSICLVIFFSSNVLSESGISWNFEAADGVPESKVLTNEVEKTDVEPNPSKSLNVDALTTKSSALMFKAVLLKSQQTQMLTQ